MMQSEVKMNSKEMLDKILKVREVRNNLTDLNISLEEKEILRRCLNHYENYLNLSITTNNLNKEELEENDIPNDIEPISIPIEENTTKYNEFAKLNDNNLIDLIKQIDNSLKDLDLSKEDYIILLKSLKEYSLYLEQLALEKINNKDLFDELDSKKI